MHSRVDLRAVLVAAIVAAFIVAALPVVAAVGDPILAGKFTWASAVTYLKGNVDTFNLKITNTHPDGSAAKFVVEAGNPPFLVTSSEKVPMLNADRLDGVSSQGFLRKRDYDADWDGVVDNALVSVRSAVDQFDVDVIQPWDGRVQCVTDPVTFDAPTTVVASGSMSLQPLGVEPARVYALFVRSEDLTTWTSPGGIGVEATPDDGTGDAAVPVAAAGVIPAGTWYFGLVPFGAEVVPGGADYDGWCELVVTAYTGLGSAIDDGITSAGSLSLEELEARKD